MPEISKSQTLRDNERIKHAATAVTALANALIIAGFGKMGFAGNFELLPSLMVLTGCFVILLCSRGLTMLQADDEI